MRTLDPALAARFATGATTFCRCWRLTRRDGRAFGFTDHDEEIVFGDVTFAARSGLDGPEAEAALGLSASEADVTGALTAEAITETDVAAGLWDMAAVEVWLVDWSDPALRLLLDAGTLRALERGEFGFRATLAGIGALFEEPKGRLYQARCSADLGDPRCGVDLALAANGGAGTVLRTDGRLTVETAGFADFPADAFTGGTLRWNTGANAGTAVEIRSDGRAGDGARVLALWQAAARPIAAGDAFTCHAQYQMTAAGDVGLSGNKRDMPGNDSKYNGLKRFGNRNRRKQRAGSNGREIASDA